MHASKLSYLAENIIGSEIIKLAGEVNAKIKQGEKINNFTIGDFDPSIFPIPTELKKAIIDAYHQNLTNYPEANGMLALRKAISNLLAQRGQLTYSADEIIVAGGARPLIYSIYRVIVDPEDKVLFAAPSWNNNHYCFLNKAQTCIVEAKPENNFMPSASDLAPYIQEVSLVALCSPQNPTGTVFTKEGLKEIGELILEENKRRSADQKPVYLLYDQIYWALTSEGTTHYNPVALVPEMKDYTIFVDGISKSLSATGVRVGWSFGPQSIIDKMRAILSHIGAWAPKAEQIATANYLANLSQYDNFIAQQNSKISERLHAFYDAFRQLKEEGYAVDAISPQAAIYLTVKIDALGKHQNNGEQIKNSRDLCYFLLNHAQLALVPFSAFGTNDQSPWFRLSIGTSEVADAALVANGIRKALDTLI